ncbi:MAG: hypothetical protein MUC61_03870 [Amoebophilaceae bacterium]|nr:hypothetical protein [Amoebophilaceae bacterium]
MSIVRRKAVLFAALGILGATTATFMAYSHSYSSESPIIVLKNFNPQAGFHYIIYAINHALYACEQSGRYKLVVCLDSGLYKEDRPHFIAENPYYNEYDWFSYYFEPINQTNQPLSYWKKRWISSNPYVKSITPTELKKSALEHTTPYKKGGSIKTFNATSLDTSLNRDPNHRAQEFHRIWHQYFKLRPYIQEIVDDFKHKHDFANKYVITLHYRGTDKYSHKYSSEDYPEHPPYEFCLALVKKLMAESGRSHKDIVTFIATDEQPFIEYMRNAGVNAVFTDSIRSDVSTSGFMFDSSKCVQGVAHNSPESKVYNELIDKSIHRGMPDKSSYIKGRDVLVDAILLGSGDVFIKSRGNVSNQASWIGGPKMKLIDLASEFRNRAK